MSTAWRSRVELGLWLAALLGGLVVTVRGGAAGADWPPLADPAGLTEWAADRHPLDTAAGLSRVAVVLLLGYLVAVTLAHLAVALAGAPIRPPRARVSRMVATLVAAAVTSSAVGAAGAAGSSAAEPSPGRGATMEAIEVPTRTDLPWAVAPVPEVVVPRIATDADDPHATTLGAWPDRPAHPEEWLVQPGDHLWNIAERTVAATLGRVPAEREIARYWTRLVSENRDRLVDPEEPDLILPGQSLRLP
jgi:nucleoid-associated protein YgaU